MLLKEILDTGKIPELDTQKVIADIETRQNKIIGNCTSRETIARLHISEEQFKGLDQRNQMEKMVQDFNRAVTDALFNELQRQIKNGNDVEAKNFLLKAKKQ